MRLGLQLSAVIVTFVLLVAPAVAQINPNLEQGFKPFGTYHTGDVDSVNLINGNLSLDIPLVSYPQRGKLSLSFSAGYNNKGWWIKNWQTPNPSPLPPTQHYLWKWGNGAANGVVATWDQAKWVTTNPNTINGVDTADTYTINESSGGSHQLAAMQIPIASSFETIDVSGLRWNYPSGSGISMGTIIDRDGTQYDAGASSGSGTAANPWLTNITDSNGNRITHYTFAGGSPSDYWIDTLGRAIPGGTYGNASTGFSPGAATSDFTSCPSGTSLATLWQPPGYAGGTTTLKFCYATFGLATNFNVSIDGVQVQEGGATVTFMTGIVLPNGKAWTFAYNSYGDLTQVGLPWGGNIQYGWENDTICNTGGSSNPSISRWVNSRSVDANDGKGPQAWHYKYQPGSATTVTDPLNNDTVHTITAVVPGAACSFYVTETKWFQGPQGTGTLLKTVDTHYTGTTNPFSQNYGDGTQGGNIVADQVTTTWPNGKVNKITTQYDSGAVYYMSNGPAAHAPSYPLVYGSVVQENEYDFGSATTPARQKVTNFQWQANGNYLSANLLNLPSSAVIQDSAGHECAETDFAYDDPARLTSANISTNHFAAPGPVRGNPSSSTHWLSSTPCQANASWTTLPPDFVNIYDTGEVYQEIDPLGNSTTHSYDPAYAGAYVTKTCNALNQCVSATYDLNTGLVTKFTDQNSQSTTYIYNDSMYRVTEVDDPDLGKTTYNYNSDTLPLTVTETVTATPDPSIVTSTVYDGLGRTHKTILSSDPQGPDYTRVDYDGVGHQIKTWNPTRCDPDTSPNSCSGESTWGTTQFAYDALGRVTSVTHPDGAVATTNYTGPATEVTEEGNGATQVQHITQTDAFGRLVSVCEVSTTTQAGQNSTPAACGLDIAGNGFLTSYQYDTLGNLVRVSQAGMTDRTSTYDSMSRLLCSSNPEISNAVTCPTPDNGAYTPGTLRYAYDANGNVVTRVAPRPNQTNPSVTVTTTYSPDQLNRIFQVQYSDLTSTSGTPTVHMDYDLSSDLGVSSLTNTVGRVAAEYVTDGSGTKLAGSVFSYDPAGRIKVNSQCTPQNCPSNGTFGIAYGYDLAGGMNSASNGEGVTLSHVYDAAGRIQSVASSLVDANHPATLLSNPVWGPTAVNSFTLGNGWGESRSYDSRERLQQQLNGPLTSVPAKAGTGSVTINGTLASYQQLTQGATSGKGTVTIYGQEQSLQQCYYGTCHPIYDRGSVSITVNGFTKSVTYGSNDTTNSVASGLASAFNSDSTSPVSASASSSIVTLTAKATGTGTNYSLSASSPTWLSYDFGSPSFTPTTSGTTLTGGSNAVYTTAYDSGTTTITVNGHPDSYAWSGSGTTTASIASGLASAITADGAAFVNGTASGSTVNLTARQTGVTTDYTLSASSSSSQNSFTTQASGGALTGGANASSYINTQYSFSLGYAPDSNITTANDSVNGNWNYTYDDLNRLHTAVANNGKGCIESYDRYANRWSQAPYGTGNSCGGATLSFTGNGAGNNNRMDGYTYDAAGNLLSDGVGHNFTYDAENRIVAVGGTSAATYVYDAEGQRVRSVRTSGTVDFLYDLEGHAMTEVNSTGGWNRGEIYAGEHLATYQLGTTLFAHTDWLGNERMRSQMNGAVYSTWTSFPFGEGSSTPNPSPLLLSGKERDQESGLDDFGARYYSSVLGRFVTPDWSAEPVSVPFANFGDPQSLNLYMYVGNNPASQIDADGHYVEAWGGTGDDAEPYARGCHGLLACEWEIPNAKDSWTRKRRISPDPPFCGRPPYKPCPPKTPGQPEPLRVNLSVPLMYDVRYPVLLPQRTTVPTIGTIGPDDRIFNIKVRRCLRQGADAAAKDFFWPVDLFMYSLSKFDSRLFGEYDGNAPWFSTGAGIGTQAMEAVGEHIAEDRAAQKGIKALAKRYGQKMSNKAIGRAGSKFAKAGLPLHAAFALTNGALDYNGCMTE